MRRRWAWPEPLSPQRVAAFVESPHESQNLSPPVAAGLSCARSIQPRALSWDVISAGSNAAPLRARLVTSHSGGQGTPLGRH